MKLLNNIKQLLGQRAMLREVNDQRMPEVRNLKDAASVGIVYHAVDEATFKQVKNFVKEIKEDIGIHRIMALGFIDDKHLPHYMNARLNFDHFSQKDLNWWLRPGGNTVENFIAEEYQILIDLTLEDVLPVQYVVARSRASFKVGRLSKSNERSLDMMIDMAGVQSQAQLIKQIDRYLRMINSRPEPVLHGA